MMVQRSKRTRSLKFPVVSLTGLIFILSIQMISSAHARMDIVPGSRYSPARAEAMGDAYLPMGTDGASGLFYNPALLSKVKRPTLEFVNAQIYGNAGLVSTFNQNFTNIFSLSGYRPNLESSVGTLAGAGFAFAPHYSVRGFSIGVLFSNQVAGQVNPDGSVSYRSQYQLIPAIGGGISLANGVLRLGYSLQFVNQASGFVRGSLTATEYTDELTQGSGLSSTLGLMLTIPNGVLPSFSLVARNLFGTFFSSNSLYSPASNPLGAPPTEPMTFDFAIGLHPRMGNGSILSIVFAGRDLFNASNTPDQARIAIGTELEFRKRFFIRAGWRGGQPSLGIGFHRLKTEFSISWYTVDIGGTFGEFGDTRILFQYRVSSF